MPQTVYIETTIISYLTARISRDLVIAGQQQMTREWWEKDRLSFQLFSSQFVMLEAAAGDQKAADERIKILATLPMLEIEERALQLADDLVQATALPRNAIRDAEHVGVCATNGMDFLLTWNCRHLANAKQRDKIAHVCQNHGLSAPTICTPADLFGDDNGN
jgi:hypothetical protein